MDTVTFLALRRGVPLSSLLKGKKTIKDLYPEFQPAMLKYLSDSEAALVCSVNRQWGDLVRSKEEDYFVIRSLEDIPLAIDGNYSAIKLVSNLGDLSFLRRLTKLELLWVNFYGAADFPRLKTVKMLSLRYITPKLDIAKLFPNLESLEMLMYLKDVIPNNLPKLHTLELDTYDDTFVMEFLRLNPQLKKLSLSGFGDFSRLSTSLKGIEDLTLNLHKGIVDLTELHHLKRLVTDDMGSERVIIPEVNNITQLQAQSLHFRGGSQKYLTKVQSLKLSTPLDEDSTLDAMPLIELVANITDEFDVTNKSVKTVKLRVSGSDESIIYTGAANVEKLSILHSYAFCADDRHIGLSAADKESYSEFTLTLIGDNSHIQYFKTDIPHIEGLNWETFPALQFLRVDRSLVAEYREQFPEADVDSVLEKE